MDEPAHEQHGDYDRSNIGSYEQLLAEKRTNAHHASSGTYGRTELQHQTRKTSAGSQDQDMTIHNSSSEYFSTFGTFEDNDQIRSAIGTTRSTKRLKIASDHVTVLPCSSSVSVGSAGLLTDRDVILGNKDNYGDQIWAWSWDKYDPGHEFEPGRAQSMRTSIAGAETAFKFSHETFFVSRDATSSAPITIQPSPYVVPEPSQGTNDTPSKHDGAPWQCLPPNQVPSRLGTVTYAADSIQSPTRCHSCDKVSIKANDRVRFPVIAGFNCIFATCSSKELKITSDCTIQKRFLSQVRKHHERHNFFYCTDCFRVFDNAELRDDHKKDAMCWANCVTEDCANNMFTTQTLMSQERPKCKHERNSPRDQWRALFRIAQSRFGFTYPDEIPEPGDINEQRHAMRERGSEMVNVSSDLLLPSNVSVKRPIEDHLSPRKISRRAVSSKSSGSTTSSIPETLNHTLQEVLELISSFQKLRIPMTPGVRRSSHCANKHLLDLRAQLGNALSRAASESSLHGDQGELKSPQLTETLPRSVNQNFGPNELNRDPASVRNMGSIFDDGLPDVNFQPCTYDCTDSRKHFK